MMEGFKQGWGMNFTEGCNLILSVTYTMYETKAAYSILLFILCLYRLH